MKSNRCFILGSGSSIRQNLWNVPIYYLPIWKALGGEIVFGLNWSYLYHESTIQMFSDYQFYIAKQKVLNVLPLIVGADSPHIGIREYEPNKKCEPGKNLILLPMTNKYNGENSWTKGFYSTQLIGMLALTYAIALGFKNIYLLGFDCCETNDFDGKKHTHFYDDDKDAGWYEWQNKKKSGVGFTENGKYKTSTYNDNSVNDKWFSVYKNEVKKRNIWNVSLNSKLTTFCKLSYNELYKTIQLEPSNIDQNKVRKEIVDITKEKLKYNPFNRKKQIFV